MHKCGVAPCRAGTWSSTATCRWPSSGPENPADERVPCAPAMSVVSLARIDGAACIGEALRAGHRLRHGWVRTNGAAGMAAKTAVRFDSAWGSPGRTGGAGFVRLHHALRRATRLGLDASATGRVHSTACNRHRRGGDLGCAAGPMNKEFAVSGQNQVLIGAAPPLARGVAWTRLLRGSVFTALEPLRRTAAVRP